MKCPSCEYTCSDLRDLCPQCSMDLRSHKKMLGIRISNPDISYQELLKKSAKPSTTKTVPKPSSAPSHQKAASPLFSKADLKNALEGISKTTSKIRSFFAKAEVAPAVDTTQVAGEVPTEIKTEAEISQLSSTPLVTTIPEPELEAEPSPSMTPTPKMEPVAAIAPVSEIHSSESAPPAAPSGPAVMDLSNAEDLSLEELTKIIGEPEESIQVTIAPPPEVKSEPEVSIEFEIEDILADDPQLHQAQASSTAGTEISLQDILEHSYEQEPSTTETKTVEFKTIDEEIPRVEQIADATPTPPATVPTVEMIDYQAKEPPKVQVGDALSEEELNNLSEAVAVLDIEAEEEDRADRLKSAETELENEAFVEESPQSTESQIFEAPEEVVPATTGLVAPEQIAASTERVEPTEQSSTRTEMSTPIWLLDPDQIIELYEISDRELKFSRIDSEIELSLEQFKTFQSAEDIILLYDMADDAIEHPEIEKVYETQIETSVSKKVESRALAATLKKTERILSAPVFSLKATLKKGSGDSISEAIDHHSHHHVGFPEGTELKPPSMLKWISAFLADFAIILVGSAILAFNIDLLTKEYSAMKILSGAQLQTAELVMFTSTVFASFNLMLFLYPLISVAVWKRTFGDWLCGLRLVTEGGKKLKLKHTLVRALAYPLSALNGGFLPVFFGRRPLHDSLARVIVYQDETIETESEAEGAVS